MVIPVKNKGANLPLVLQSLPDWVTEVVLVGRTLRRRQRCGSASIRPDIKVVTQPGAGKGDDYSPASAHGRHPGDD